MSAQEQIEIIGNLDNIDELTEKYQNSTNKNRFVLRTFKPYISDAGDSRAKDKLIEMIHSLLKEGRSETQAVLEDEKGGIIDLINLNGVNYDGEPMTTGTKLKDQFASLLSNTVIDLDKVTTDNPKSIFDKNKEVRNMITAQLKTGFLKRNILVKNIEKMFAEFEERGEFQLDKKVLELDFSFADYFNASSLKQLSKRSNVYKYWTKIHKQIEELKTLLKDADIEGLDDSTISKINYIKLYEPVTLDVDALDYRAYDFVKKYLSFFLGSGAVDLDEIDGEFYFAQKQTKTAEGKDKQQGSEIDSTKVIASEFKKIMGSKKEVDILGYVHAVSNLSEGSLALSADDKKLLKSRIKELLKTYTVNMDGEFIDAMNSGIQGFMKEIQVLGSTKENNYLPIYFSEGIDKSVNYYVAQLGEFRETKPSLKMADLSKVLQRYQSLIKDKDITDSINKMLQAVKNEVVEESGVKPTAIREEGKGAGKGRKDDKEPTFYTASIRGTETKFKELNEKMKKVLNLIDATFIRPLNNRFSKGLSMGYDQVILTDLINRKDSPFVIARQLAENSAKEGLDFISINALNDIKNYMVEIKKAKQVGRKVDLNSLKRESLDMVTEIENILDTSEDRSMGFRDLILEDIASLYYAITKEKTDFEGVDTEKAYRKSRVGDYEDAQAFKQIINFLIQNKENYKASMMNEELKVIRQIEDIQNWFGKLTKSDQSMLLQAHDHIRVLKNEDIHFDVLDYNDIDDMEYFITKMNKERNIDLSSMEVYNIVKELDSFQNISNEYGISTEDVYLIKANFR